MRRFFLIFSDIRIGQASTHREPEIRDQRRRPPRPRTLFGSSKRTRKGFPSSRFVPSSPAMAALASCPSISTKPKPRHWPENTSVTKRMERTVPNLENKSLTEVSVASEGKLPTNILFTRVSSMSAKTTPPPGGEMDPATLLRGVSLLCRRTKESTSLFLWHNPSEASRQTDKACFGVSKALWNILALRARVLTGCSLHGHRFIQNFCFSETLRFDSFAKLSGK
uniref:Uncharacterized protein n=1 Tax=Candidatus Kentrum sp. LPFa TaxID=2126335 RepID=A0A450VWA0_9GAMM|nr:MAG: hypothetical protein BECKLPF1236B_GA0070989_100514 [Candidatus Kentron sp. LPFa]